MRRKNAVQVLLSCLAILYGASASADDAIDHVVNACSEYRTKPSAVSYLESVGWKLASETDRSFFVDLLVLDTFRSEIPQAGLQGYNPVITVESLYRPDTRRALNGTELLKHEGYPAAIVTVSSISAQPNATVRCLLGLTVPTEFDEVLSQLPELAIPTSRLGQWSDAKGSFGVASDTIGGTFHAMNVRAAFFEEQLGRSPRVFTILEIIAPRSLIPPSVDVIPLSPPNDG